MNDNKYENTASENLGGCLLGLVILCGISCVVMYTIKMFLSLVG